MEIVSINLHLWIHTVLHAAVTSRHRTSAVSGDASALPDNETGGIAGGISAPRAAADQLAQPDRPAYSRADRHNGAAPA